jgi:anti-sigma B factor antagonist
MHSPEPRDVSPADEGGPPPGLVRVEGEVDVASCAALWERMAAEIERSNGVILDLSETTFVDSSGLSVFVRAKRKLDTAGGSLVLRNPRPQVARVLALTGLDKVMTVEVDDPGDA